jgi:DNA-directed RNA polymerase subunit alpha
MTTASAKQRLDDLLSEGLDRSAFDELVAVVYDSYASVDLTDRRLKQLEDDVEAAGDDADRALVETLGVLQCARGHYRKAVETLRPVHSRKTAAHYLGCSLLKLGRAEEALSHLESSMSGDDDMATCVLLVEAHCALRNLEAAEEALKPFLGSEETADLLYAKAMVAELGGEYGEAIELYEKARKADPGHAGCLFRLAVNCDLNGEDERAIELYERCAALKPTYVGALINLGVLYEDAGKYYEAVNCYKRVLAIDPRHRQAQMYLKDAESSLTMYIDVSRSRHMRQIEELFSLPLTGFELSARSRNTLERKDITTLGGLTQVSRDELLNEKNFGDTSLEEIESLLSRYDLTLGGGKPEVPTDDAVGLEERAAEQARLNTPVESLDLSTRCRKCLDRLGVATLGELIQHTEAELLAVPNFGMTSLAELVGLLEDMGLSLKNA